ncbi:MAG: hypothetical protein AAFO74_13120 [Pseudomonadota bacterium]
MHSINKRVTPVVDQIWKHTKTGNTYVITGVALNTITDKLDVLYKDHLKEAEYSRFSRQISGHAKAFLSDNEDGSPRFILIALNPLDYMERLEKGELK